MIVLYIGVMEFLSEQGFEDLCIPEDVEKKLILFAMTLLILNLLLQLGVVVDSCWGWARLRRRMVTLLPWESDTVQPVNNLELGNVQAEEQSEETPVTEKVHKYHDIKKIFMIKNKPNNFLELCLHNIGIRNVHPNHHHCRVPSCDSSRTWAYL